MDLKLEKLKAELEQLTKLMRDSGAHELVNQLEPLTTLVLDGERIVQLIKGFDGVTARREELKAKFEPPHHADEAGWQQDQRT